jgi:hypothetical protein
MVGRARRREKARGVHGDAGDSETGERRKENRVRYLL